MSNDIEQHPIINIEFKTMIFIFNLLLYFILYNELLLIVNFLARA